MLYTLTSSAAMIHDFFIRGSLINLKFFPGNVTYDF